VNRAVEWIQESRDKREKRGPLRAARTETFPGLEVYFGKLLLVHFMRRPDHEELSVMWPLRPWSPSAICTPVSLSVPLMVKRADPVRNLTSAQALVALVWIRQWYCWLFSTIFSRLQFECGYNLLQVFLLQRPRKKCATNRVHASPSIVRRQRRLYLEFID